MEEVLKRQEERLQEVLWDFVKKYKARLQLRPPDWEGAGNLHSV